MGHLFEKPFHHAWQHALKLAVADVEKLDRKLISDPSLVGELEKIAGIYEVDVARFEGEVTAKRREAEREISDYGDRRKIKQTWLDIWIPFKGEAECFRVNLSSYSYPPFDAEISGNSLKVSVLDDTQADQQVKNFMAVVSKNLEALKTDYERCKPELRQTIQQAAAARTAKINEEQARDSTRSFRVIG